MKPYLVVLLSFLILLTACAEKSTPPPLAEAPRLLSSMPADKQTEVTDGVMEILLLFDQNVTLGPSPRITLNGGLVTDLRPGTGGELKLVVPPLEPAVTYTLVVPGHTIKGPTGVFLPTEIRLVFTTRTPAPPREGLSPQAEKLLLYMREHQGIAILSGTMANVAWNTNEAAWVHLHTGKYPALNCFDYIHLPFSPADWIDYGNISVVENWWKEKGLVSAMWHWNVPANSAEPGKYAFYWGSGPEETLFDIAKINDSSSEEYQTMMADIDKVSGYLKLLRDKQIPVIWRPLHEAAGNMGAYPGGTAWFWWGAGGAEPFKKLWRLMFDRMTHHHGLDNLIWVWTSQITDAGWYPGDDYVDMVGRDIYNESGTTTIKNDFTTLQERYPDKLVALSECGSVAKIPDQWNTGAKWVWFMPWYDYDRTVDSGSDAFQLSTHQHADAAWWKDAFDTDYVLTRDEMPDLK